MNNLPCTCTVGSTINSHLSLSILECVLKHFCGNLCTVRVRDQTTLSIQAKRNSIWAYTKYGVVIFNDEQNMYAWYFHIWPGKTIFDKEQDSLPKLGQCCWADTLRLLTTSEWIYESAGLIVRSYHEVKNVLINTAVCNWLGPSNWGVTCRIRIFATRTCGNGNSKFFWLVCKPQRIVVAPINGDMWTLKILAFIIKSLRQIHASSLRIHDAQRWEAWISLRIVWLHRYLQNRRSILVESKFLAVNSWNNCNATSIK